MSVAIVKVFSVGYLEQVYWLLFTKLIKIKKLETFLVVIKLLSVSHAYYLN